MAVSLLTFGRSIYTCFTNSSIRKKISLFNNPLSIIHSITKLHEKFYEKEKYLLQLGILIKLVYKIDLINIYT